LQITQIMKQLLTTCLLFLSLGIGAQNFETSDVNQGISSVDFDSSDEDNDRAAIVTISETFEEAAKKNNIAYRTLEDFQGVKDGYYAIVGVFKEGKNLKRKIKKLNKKGFDSGFIENPENNTNYVYIQHFPFGLEAIDAVVNKFEGKYKDDVWILKIDNSYFTQSSDVENNGVDNDSNSLGVNEVTYDMLNEADNSANQSNQIDDPSNKSKLVKKADSYFNKMWYAEAAELYEQALKKEGKNYSYEIIQKAADSYYFNTNMEKAFKWYNVLYEKYGKDMSADNIFKYAHSLKGTGKYARSKRLMRLYGKKIENGESVGLRENVQLPNEIVLDGILNNEVDYNLKNLSINTKYSDFSPMFLDSTQMVFTSAKDSSFLNTRRYKWNNQPYLDLYVAKLNEESLDLKNATKFSKKINTKYHEASVTFSPDNTTMYFTRNNYGKKLVRDKNGVNHLKIYMSKKVNGDWIEAVEVPFNSDDYSTGHPALSPDGKQLYFVSDMPGSIGQTDIFVVDVTGPNSFSEPRNLGPEINTERKEMFPFINDKKLYFSSDGHTGLGGLDIYEVAYTEEEGFEEVKNLGKPINSNRDDFSYIINEENQQGFFASNRIDGNV